jgi:hypothetical protein
VGGNVRALSAIVVCALVAVLSACGGSLAAGPVASPSRSPVPTNRDKLVLYLRQIKPVIADGNSLDRRWNAVMTKSLSYDKDRTWSRLQQRIKRLMPAIEQLGVDCAAVTPPQQLSRAHGKLVGSARSLCSLGSAYLDALRYGSNYDFSGFKHLLQMAQKANAQYGDWEFAVQVEAKRQHVKIPFDITRSE